MKKLWDNVFDFKYNQKSIDSIFSIVGSNIGNLTNNEWIVFHLPKLSSQD